MAILETHSKVKTQITVKQQKYLLFQHDEYTGKPILDRKRGADSTQ